MKNESTRKKINVDKPNYSSIWAYKQEDDGVLKLALFKDSTPLDITGQTIKLGAKRPNNSIIELTEGFKINNNELDIKLKNNILAVPGIVECDLEITDEVGRMTTASFYLTINKKITGEDNLNASNDISAINKIVEEVLAKGKELDSNIKVLVEQANKKITTIDTALNQKLNEMQADYNSLQKIIIDKNQAANLQNQVNKTNAQLDTITQEVEKPITLNKCDSEMLAAIQNKEGETTFNLLSIPRDSSVTPSKLDSATKDSIFNIEKFDDTSSTKKGVVNSSGVFLLNKEFINCLISKMVIKFTQPAVGEIRIYENVNGVLNEVDTIDFNTTELGGLNPTIELNYRAKNAYIGITKTSGTVDFGSFVTYGLLTYSDKTQTTFNISDCEVFNNFSLPFYIESLTLKGVKSDEIDKKMEDIEQKLNETNTNIEVIKDNLISTINVERSEILKNNKVYLVNGVETVGNGEWYTSSFIDISNGGTIVGYGIKSIDGIAFYDENKKYVTSIKPTISTTSANIFKAEITTEKDQYKYCRVVSCVYSNAEFVGSISTYTNAIEKLENRVAFLEKNIGTVKNNIITVGKIGCDFTDIQLAINSIIDDSPTNRYLILVYPGEYEYFHTWVYGVKPIKTQRYISIVGYSKYDCVVNSAFSSTFTSNGVLKNMTLICNPTEMNVDYDTVYGYALHIDMNQNNAGMKITIEDCDLISYKGATVGMGCWQNDDITFKRCNFIRKENISTQVNHIASKMALYCHNAQWSAPQQNFNLIDCNLNTPYEYAMYLHDTLPNAEKPSYLYCNFKNNNIYSTINGFNCITGQSVTKEPALFGQGIILSEDSYGNTNNLLNNNIGTVLSYR